MGDIQLKWLSDDKGAFIIEEENERVAEMVFGIKEKNLTVYHTEVSEQLKGKGIAPLLLNALVAYAREQQLKVIPRCEYVHVQFKRHPEQYSDLWSA